MYRIKSKYFFEPGTGITVKLSLRRTLVRSDTFLSNVQTAAIIYFFVSGFC